jgi:hypothetical protein
MTQPKPKFSLKRDKIVGGREIKPGYWLFELRAGPKAHISRWVVADKDGSWLGEVKKPRYQSRAMEVYSGHQLWSSQFNLKMQAPALAEQVLIDYMVEFVEKFCGT